MNRRRWVSILALGPILCALPGCVTIWKYNDQMALLEGRLKTLEQQKEELSAVQKADRDRMEAVRKELDDATDALRKGGANLGADVDTLKQDMTRLKGVDEEHAWAMGKAQEDIDAIKKALDGLGAPIVKVTGLVEGDRDGLYAAAKEAVAKGDGPTARGLLRRFLETYPDEPRAGEAQYLFGESFFKEGKWGQAVKEYQRVHDRYKDAKGAPVGRALLRIADCLLKQGDCKKAGGVYQYLADLEKKTPEADQAKAAFKKLKKTCKGL